MPPRPLWRATCGRQDGAFLTQHQAPQHLNMWADWDAQLHYPFDKHASNKIQYISRHVRLKIENLPDANTKIHNVLILNKRFLPVSCL